MTPVSCRFLRDEGGNFAVITAILVLPIILATGAAVDLSRINSAQSHLQNLADTAAITMAASRSAQRTDLIAAATRSVQANHLRSAVDEVTIDRVGTGGDEVSIQLSANLDTTFMRLAGYGKMALEASAGAKRDVGGAVEVALVLDNTYSMIGPGQSGDKLRSLKLAATKLVDLLTEDESLDVRIGLVPYAEYVNVGLEQKGASWLVQEERRPMQCRTVTEERQCTRWRAPYRCKKLVDGNEIETTCGAECENWQTVQLQPPRQQCDNPDNRTWWGCVGSRTEGSPPNRLHDQNPLSRYLAIIDGHRACPTPIQPLTDNRHRLIEAVNAMTVKGPSYEPLTYIPAGLIWGQNVLSRIAPYSEAAEYDPDGRAPRKVMILMTDGDNTMMFHPWGRHGPLRGGDVPESKVSVQDRPVRERERAQTNSDSLAICDYSKSRGIEIYTVSFMVDTALGRGLMEQCASSPEHYFDAVNQQALLQAFEGIAGSISRVRLSR